MYVVFVLVWKKMNVVNGSTVIIMANGFICFVLMRGLRGKSLKDIEPLSFINVMHVFKKIL